MEGDFRPPDSRVTVPLAQFFCRYYTISSYLSSGNACGCWASEQPDVAWGYHSRPSGHTAWSSVVVRRLSWLQAAAVVGGQS